MLDRVKQIFSRRKRETHSAEELRVAFKDRYHQFKLLLSANNQALDVMAEVEEALQGTQPFGMSFVRERCIRVSTNVYRIIKHLNNLAPGKYEALYDKFNEIQTKIKPHLDSLSIQNEGPLVVSLADIRKEHSDQVGGKMANLGEIRSKIGLCIPSGFVITSAAYQRFMDHNQLRPEIDRRTQSSKIDRLDELHALTAGLQQLIMEASIPPDLEAAILEHYRRLEETEGAGCLVAMRSSAIGEDLQGATLAGQYHSVLDVGADGVLDAYKEVLASKYSMRAITYRLNRGIRDEDVAMCVGCMRMIEAAVGGVIYSRNPLNIRDDSIVINSVWGLPKAVVDGIAIADNFVVSRDDPPAILDRVIPARHRQYVRSVDEEDICAVEMTDEERQAASLTDEQVLRLARMAIQLEEYYQTALDIEWCIDENGAIVVLQCRPLKQIDVQDAEDAPFGPESERGPVILQGGVTAAPGVAAGPVHIVKTENDVLEFPDGGVLVAEQALPNWAMLLNRAAAVVTEQGGVTGHLANVAREFGVPALFAAQGAVGLLQPGAMVTVDADALKIYEGRVFELLKKERKARNLMEGSAVYEALKSAAEHIVHLSLLDPDALAFKPESCKTLHDITRFCHEKSVAEMFRFGKDHHFPERSSKRLIEEVPMQWWILNLDDGFKEEVEGKHVRLDNIVSIPMLALWEGITAVPWGGPPPVDGKGFLSVMFQATQNTALAPGARSKYTDRNYFMISKNFCSLSSRLGFHFSIVEALISDRSEENYISFQFKGGAADYERRRKRVFFVKELLEGYHFRVQVKDDNLIARLEDFEKDFMIRSLKIVGYMAIHTRQLDMIMSNRTMVNYYRNKICKDIQEHFVKEKVLYLYVGDGEQVGEEPPEEHS